MSLQVKGELWQMVQATPMAATFGRLTPDSANGAALVRKLTIVNNSDGPVSLTNITSTSPSFKAEVNTLETGKKFELVVTVVPPFKPGATAGQVELSTGLTEMPKLMIPVNVYFTADIEVTPSELAIPLSRVTTLQRQLYVRNYATAPVKINDLKVLSGSIKGEIQETQPGVAFKISLDIPKEYKIPAGGDSIVFHTSNPNVPTMSVPVKEMGVPAMPPAGVPSPPLGSAKPANQAQGLSGAKPAATNKPATPPAPPPKPSGH